MTPRARREPVNGDLFGAPKSAPKDQTPTVLRLDLVEQSCTPKAWFLREPFKGGKAGFAPRSEASPVEGREGFWEMPRWLAKERGWL